MLSRILAVVGRKTDGVYLIYETPADLVIATQMSVPKPNVIKIRKSEVAAVIPAGTQAPPKTNTGP